MPRKLDDFQILPRRDSSLTKLPEEGDEVEELEADCEEFDGIGGVAQAESDEPSQEGMSPLCLGNGVWVLLVFGLIRALKGGILQEEERIFFVCVIVSAMVIFSSISILSIMTNAMTQLRNHKEKLEQFSLLRKCLTQCNITGGLMARVQSISSAMKRPVHKEDIKALHLLPPSLWQYLNQEVRKLYAMKHGGAAPRLERWRRGCGSHHANKHKPRRECLIRNRWLFYAFIGQLPLSIGTLCLILRGPMTSQSTRELLHWTGGFSSTLHGGEALRPPSALRREAAEDALRALCGLV